MISVFVSYRREDSRHQAGRLFDRLVAQFGSGQVFKDVDSIPLGLDFREVLTERVAACDVFLAVIVDEWLSIAGRSGNRRLDDPGDLVRIEIEAALSRDIPVIPVLVGKSSVPKAEELPKSMRELAYRNATSVRPNPDFHYDIERLIRGIKGAVAKPRARPPWVWPSVALGVLTLGLLAAWLGDVLRVRTPDGVIVLENVPNDAEILVDDRKITQARPGAGKPLVIRAVPGQRRIEVRKDGFKTLEEVVTVKTDESEEVTVRLEPLVEDRRVKKEEPASQAKENQDTKSKPEPVSSRADVARLHKEITNSIDMKLVLIPAGNFRMGSLDDDKDAEVDEKPRHEVRISAFCLGVTEVTRGQFRRFVDETGHKTEAEKDGKGGYGWSEVKGKFEQDPKYTWLNAGFEQTDEHPAVNVIWDDAVAFCEWLSRVEDQTYRLPNEAEWEYACRARKTSRYFSGDDPESLAAVGNVADATAKAKFAVWTWAIAGRDGYVYTAPVRQFQPNAFGLYDMHGNVWEWCHDGYDAEYYKRSPADDPPGPSRASGWVIRGGSWRNDPRDCRSANRVRLLPTNRNNTLGFRVARDQSPR